MDSKSFEHLYSCDLSIVKRLLFCPLQRGFIVFEFSLFFQKSRPSNWNPRPFSHLPVWKCSKRSNSWPYNNNYWLKSPKKNLRSRIWSDSKLKKHCHKGELNLWPLDLDCALARHHRYRCTKSKKTATTRWPKRSGKSELSFLRYAWVRVRVVAKEFF